MSLHAPEASRAAVATRAGAFGIVPANDLSSMRRRLRVGRSQRNQQQSARHRGLCTTRMGATIDARATRTRLTTNSTNSEHLFHMATLHDTHG